MLESVLVSADGDESPGAESTGMLRTEELMVGVRERALGSSRPEGDDFTITPTLSAARELLASDRLLASRLLGDGSDWELETYLRFESHRPLLGRVLIAVKRYLLLPPLRWLFEYSRQNFFRQREINRALLAYVEVLARENARLRVDLERHGPSPAAESRSETPAS